MAVLETKCPGCSRKTNLGAAHCKYPSNPEINAQFPIKSMPLDKGVEQTKRRDRSRAIRAQNAD